MPFRTPRSLGATHVHRRPVQPRPLTPSPRNRFMVHYSEDSSTGAASENAGWGSSTSPRLLESIRQVEQYGQEHTSRVQQLQVCFASLAGTLLANRCLL